MSRSIPPALAIILTVGLISFVPTSVSAEEISLVEPKSIETAKLESSEILDDVSLYSKSEETTERVSEYLAEQATLGNYLDAKEVNTSRVVNPLTEAPIELLWADGVAPVEMNIARVEHEAEGESQDALGVAMGQDPDGESTENVSVDGMGYGPADTSGMSLKDNHCWSAYFEPNFETVAGNHHQMTSCFEKFQSDDDPLNWAYNRWGLWHTEQPDSAILGAAVVDYTLRSRPWEGLEDTFVQTNDYAPRIPSSDCTPGTTITLGYGGSGINIPFDNCEWNTIHIQASEHRMGIEWNGERAGQVGLQMGHHVSVHSAITVPFWADYNYADIQTCPKAGQTLACVTPPFPTYAYLHTDEGW